MAEKKTLKPDTSFGTISAEFIAEFIKKNATPAQIDSFAKSAFPRMYAVPVLDENGVQLIQEAHESKEAHKKMKAKPMTKWTIPEDEKQEKEFINKGYKLRKNKNGGDYYSHLHAKNWLISSVNDGGMREILIEKGYDYLIPKDEKPVAKSETLFAFLKK